ncbi:NACHT domain protein [Talaromyces proteolyticus]|uniref:NACHT domain protein n=1 Tax=Talaromyces proteolyticus TaxID=1131652 RepID=A0AAD4KFU3_9EURO|nr:NACHT domain protein [Talaromyces proteolyticus]KAH8690051.1 NACHT domain protein [Talaromyces proteolyticus]
MAVSLATFGKCKPEIQLAQAISEYEAVLSTDEKTSLRHLKARHQDHSADAIDVIRLTAEIDQISQIGRRCVGTRFANVLHAIQAFAAIGDVVVGGTQNMMASGLWALVRFTLQIATNHFSFLEKFSELFMNIGRSAPRYQNLGLLYPHSSTLQRSICEYFTNLVQLCTKAVQITRKRDLNPLGIKIFRSFDSEFGGFLVKLEALGNEIKEEVAFLSAKTQQDEVRQNYLFRSLLLNKIDKSDRSRRNLAIKLALLDRCSKYDYGSTWRQIRKNGNSSWIRQAPEYVEWRGDSKGGTVLTCFGKLGSGKSVLAANITEDLITHVPKGTTAYFFCRYDIAQSLKARTIIGSLIRQLVEPVDPEDGLDSMSLWTDETQTHSFGLDELVHLFREFESNVLKNRIVYLIIDGLDDCEQSEMKILFEFLQTLAEGNSIKLFLTTRSELEPTAAFINEYFPQQFKLNTSSLTDEINDYIHNKLDQCLKSCALRLANPAIIIEIQDTLKANARGMFLWVVLQIDSLCDEESDDAILTALRDMPPDLPAVYDRILQKNSRSKYRNNIFQLVSSAYRPLTLWELREALSVVPGENTMDTTKFVNDIRKTVSCCGGLLELNEEALTVHFVHPSAKQHLLFPDVESSARNSTPICFSKQEADMLMGKICVTYLSWNVFETRLATLPTPWQINGSSTVSAAMNSTSQNASVAKVAREILRKRRQSSSSRFSSFDLKHALMNVQSGTSNERPPQDFLFLPYAKKYWLHHTKYFTESMGKVWILWKNLIDSPPSIIGDLPWNISPWLDHRDPVQRRMAWASNYVHHSLLFQIVLEHREVFLKAIEAIDEAALDYQLKGDWAKAAELRQMIVIRMERIRTLVRLDFMRAMWDLALSYQACEAHEKAKELLTKFLLGLKGPDRPVVQHILDSSMAFQRARNNIRHREIAEQLLNKTLSFSREFLGENNFNTLSLLHDVEHFGDRRAKNLAL